MSGLNRKKKLKPVDIVTDCIIAGVVIVLLIVVGTTAVNKEKGRAGSHHDSDVTKGMAEPKTVNGEEGELRYACVITEGSSNDTIFYVTFHPDRMTYEESIQVSDKTSELDKGTYEERNKKMVTTSSEGKKQLTYVTDGEYLIVESEMYDGTIPSGDTFDAVCTYEVKDECKKRITFKKDGTYEQELVSYAQKGSSEQDSKEKTTGTYQRKGKFIQRISDSKESLLDFYIYEDKISNAYYRLVQ